VKRIDVERKSEVSLLEVAREHLREGGKPVIITDATKNWPARSEWTFEFFKTAYGSDPVIAWRGLGSGVGKLTTLSSYIDYLDSPLGELPGLWTGKKIGKDGRPPPAAPGRRMSPFYLLDWYAFRQHPELYNDIAPAPDFLPDWASALSPTVRTILERTSGAEYWAIYVGPEGSLSKLHRDYWSTHGYLAQIRGRKRAILFPPEDSEFVYGGKVDPEQPNFDQFPLFRHATSYECVIEPGETLLTPANWWHHVRGLEKSITVSHNFFNDSNFTDHVIHILRNLPALMNNIDNSPAWRQELRIEWNT
jgi:Cupin-like domain